MSDDNNFSIDVARRHLLEYVCKEIVPGYSLSDDDGGRKYEFRDLAERCDKKVAEHALMVLKDLSNTSKKPHAVTARRLKNVILRTSQKINDLENELQELKDGVKMLDLIDYALSAHYKEFNTTCDDEEDGDKW